MNKSVSLEHTSAYYGHPNDYRLYGNRDYVATTAHCKWVKLWVDWSVVQPNPGPSDLTQLWTVLGQWSGWANLDGQIARANADGVPVILQFEPHTPAWATGASGAEAGTGKDITLHWPASYDVGSPWERFISYCYNRYRPGAGVAAGGAYISAIEPFNEPNELPWPQEDNLYCRVSQMVQTLENAFAFWGPYCTMLIPGVADVPERITGGVRHYTEYSGFVDGLLGMLASWRPRFYVAWSQHNYRDIRDGKYDPSTGTTLNHYRAYNTVSLLKSQNWRGGGDRNLWLTEGGYQLQDNTAAEKQKQSDRIQDVFGAMTGIPEVQLFSQHLIFDGGSFRSGIRACTTSGGVVTAIGSPYPAWYMFANA